MHVEVTRLITAWLNHSENGVNVLLPDVSRDLIGGVLEDEEPAQITIYNDIDFEIDGVLGVNPPKRPSLVVIADMEPDGTDIGEKFKPAHVYGFTIGVGFYSEFEKDRARARRDGNYVLRAVGQSLVRFTRAKQSERELNDVQISKLTKLTFQRVAGAVPSSTLMGMVFADGLLLNKAP